MKKDGSWVGGARMQVVDQEGINVGGRSRVMQKMGEKWQKGWGKQAQDKFSKGNIEEAMDITNPEEEEFEMRVRNGTLPTKAVMYHIRKNKTEDKRAGYRDTMCPRCGQSKEDQFHVFVVGKLENQNEGGQVNEEGYKENENEQVGEKTDQEEGELDGGASSGDQTEMNWDWEVSNQQHEIEKWYRQVHGWDDI